MGNSFKTLLIWLGLGLILIMSFNALEQKTENRTEVKYSEFITAVKDGKIDSVELESESVMQGYVVKGSYKDADKAAFYTNAPIDHKMVETLIDSKVAVNVKPEKRPNILVSLLYSVLPILLLIAVWVYFMRQQMGGGRGGAFSFGKSRARLLDKDANVITFADVAGCDEAKEEVQEIVDYLKSPSRYQSLGGRVPRGVLLFGSPGTGKTLLAKAIAGEAKVPFFSISGSDFVEMFVGVGASRVRDMFEQAKKNAPCIIFIDEIDAVGRHRGSGMGGGHDEREQTLNQLLVEMDGFEGNDGVIVIAATNRVDVLDKALLRPGRFDRQVSVGLPDIKGREQILNVHLKKLPQTIGVDVNALARGTPGFSGAQLANLVNEAALFAARRNKSHVDMNDFEDAKDKLYMGPERKSMVLREEERRATAYHEAGHALVAQLLPGTDPVHKVTIMPRGWALGVTWQLPEQDAVSNYKDKMLNELSILFGGRIAEEIFVNRKSTGASNDFERATKMARAMVAKYGMSDNLGIMVYEAEEHGGYIGGSTRTISEATQQKVDDEIRRILEEQYNVAYKLIDDNHDKMHAMVDALMKWETIDREQFLQIMNGEEPREPKEYPVGRNLDQRDPSSR